MYAAKTEQKMQCIIGFVEGGIARISTISARLLISTPLIGQCTCSAMNLAAMIDLRSGV